MIERNQLEQLSGCEVYGSDGEKIGKAGQVYLDDQTGQPDWITVNTGLFGMSESFVPLRDASFNGDRIEVPYDKSLVKDAPNVAAEAHLSQEEEQQLYRHYSLDWGTAAPPARDRDDSGVGDLASRRGTESNETTRRSTDDAMTRSEERVQVGTQDQEAGRARLRKYVVTENVTETVPVRKEKAVLEREEITDENRDAAMSGPDISEEEHEVTLHEEKPVVGKTTEPVERVRLGTEAETDEETVTEQVRKEKIEAEGDVADRRRT